VRLLKRVNEWSGHRFHRGEPGSAAVATPQEAADGFLRQIHRRPLRAFWLDILLALGVAGVAVAVWDAATVSRNAMVVVNDVRKGETFDPDNVVYAPLRVSPRNVTKNIRLEQFVAARDVSAGSLLRRRDLAPRRPRARAGELELSLRVFVGQTPPTVGEHVILSVVGVERGGPAVIPSRVLAVDSLTDPAHLTVATSQRDALALAAIPQPQIQLLHRPHKGAHDEQ
jgi:hypothetical protein